MNFKKLRVVHLLVSFMVLFWAFSAWSLDPSKVSPGDMKPGNMKPPPVLKPDLVVEKVYMSKTPNPPYTPASEFKWGTVMLPVCEFSNRGSALHGNWKLTFLIDGKVEGTLSRGDMAAESRQQGDMGMLVTTGFSQGTHALECILDREGTVPENNKINNKKGTTFLIVQ